METLTIRTGRTGFVMPERMLCLTSDRIEITTTVSVPDVQVHTGIEILAQTGAFHLRHLSGLTRHAFLLKIERYSATKACPDPGLYHVSGVLVSRSALAFAYDLAAVTEGEVRFEGRFLFALRDYDQEFQQSYLESHYRNLLSCLKNDTPKS